MSNDEAVNFRIEISRELGAIAENLRRIDEHLMESKNVTQVMWKKIDKNSSDIASMKIKLAIISAVTSFIVANFDTIIRFITK